MTLKKTPKISVVTVCYNAVETIEKTILSVLNQTYSNVEYIIIDGVSTDGTIDIINKYRDRIAYFVSEPDKGIYDAMNKGIKAATGDWINFMNAGDVFYKNSTIDEVFCGNAYSEEIKVLYGDVVIKAGVQNEYVKHIKVSDESEIAFSINHQSCFTKRDILFAIGFDTTYKIAADANSFFEIYRRGYSFEHIPIPISIYDNMDGVSSTNPMSLFGEYVRIRNISIFDLKFCYGLFRAIIFFIIGKMPNRLSKKIFHFYFRNRIK